MKCLPTNNVMPVSFNECCNCPYYDNCFDKRELKREGIIWLFVHFLKNYVLRIVTRKTAGAKIS